MLIFYLSFDIFLFPLFMNMLYILRFIWLIVFFFFYNVLSRCLDDLIIRLLLVASDIDRNRGSLNHILLRASWRLGAALHLYEIMSQFWAFLWFAGIMAHFHFNTFKVIKVFISIKYFVFLFYCYFLHLKLVVKHLILLKNTMTIKLHKKTFWYFWPFASN